MVTSYEEYFLFIVNIIVALGIGVVVLAVVWLLSRLLFYGEKNIKTAGGNFKEAPPPPPRTLPIDRTSNCLVRT